MEQGGRRRDLSRGDHRRARSRDGKSNNYGDEDSRRPKRRRSSLSPAEHRRASRPRRRSPDYQHPDNNGRRRNDSETPKRRRRGRRRSRRGRNDRRRRSSTDAAVRSPRRGSVSADDPKLPSQRSSSASSRDDTVGHFRGGPGTVVDHRFRLLRDVGMGTFGRVMECEYLKGNRQDWRLAIKIVRNVKRYTESAKVEAEIIKQVNRRGGRGDSHFAVLYDNFSWNSHYCLVFEHLGLSLYDFMKSHNYQPFPPCCVRDFARQLLEALEFIHRIGLIHTDLKPENILLTDCRQVSHHYRGRTYQIPESTKVKVIDFGGATYDHQPKSSIVATRQYRAPEVILAAGWSMPSDMWSAGCIVAELYLGELLFATHDNVEHLALMEKVVGSFPGRLLKRAKNSALVDEAFDASGRHRLARALPRESVTYVEKVQPLEHLIRKDDRPLYELLRRLLEIDPDARATGKEAARFRF